jgi:predicted Zn-dependent protease
LVSPLLGSVVGGLGGLASDLVLAPYSREQEREADRLGQTMAARAGWDPSGTTAMLRTLEREEALQGGKPDRFSFLATHPTTPERVANTAAYAKELPRIVRDPIKPSVDAFLEVLSGLPTDARAANGVFVDGVFLHPGLAFSVRFPAEWRTQNTQRQVAAAPPKGGAFMVLRMVADGDDPLAGAHALEQATRAPIARDTRREKIGALRAARTRVRADSDDGPLLLDLTWIAYGGHVYEIAGLTPLARADALRPTFDAVAESFRPLTSDEAARIKENRLRLMTARAQESLSALVTRVQSVWKVEQVAVANALVSTASLRKDQLVKAAIAEPYRK